jgi:hypothetical protein
VVHILGQGLNQTCLSCQKNRSGKSPKGYDTETLTGNTTEGKQGGGALMG